MSSSSLELVRPVPVHLLVPPWEVKVSSPWTSARSVFVYPESDPIDPNPQEFNARTAHITTGVPIPARVTVRPDRSFSFDLRTPTTTYLLLNAANVEPRKNRLRGAMNPGHEYCGKISLKHIYEIAKIKHTETRLSGLSLEGLCKSVMSQAKSIGIQVVP